MKNRVYITDFGAEPNSGVQTKKIQAAIDDCFNKGGGEVIVPSGDFETGGIRLRSNITLRLEKNAHLIGSRNPADYYGIRADKIEPLSDADITDALWTPPAVRKNYHHMNKAGSAWNNALIKAVDAEKISIIGEEGSYIDGQDCYDATGEECYRGPHAINLFRCRDVSFAGYTVKNSANWAHALFDCIDISMKNVTVLAGHDGIHLTSCKKIKIEESNFYTGDDCVAGIDNHDMSVSQCTMNTACSAFRLGGINILIDGCKMFGPAKYLFRGSLSDEEKRTGASAGGTHRYNMLSAYTYYSDFSRDIKHPAGNIVMQNCEISNADRFLHYNFSGNETWQKNKPLADITFKNIKAAGIKYPITAYGDTEKKIKLTFKDCLFDFGDERGEAPFMHLCNYDRVVIENCEVKNINGNTLIKSWSRNGALVFTNLDSNGFSGENVCYTEEPFVCDSI